jgi:hypothetical protein
MQNREEFRQKCHDRSQKTTGKKKEEGRKNKRKVEEKGKINAK